MKRVETWLKRLLFWIVLGVLAAVIVVFATWALILLELVEK